MSNAADCQLWVDTDMGFDDMHALLCLRHAGITPVAQSLVFGCSALSQVHRNTQGFNALFSSPFSQNTAPWYSGAPHSLNGETRTAELVLGAEGLLTRGLSLPEGSPLPSSPTAVTALTQWLSSEPGNAQILAMGPLTNIAQLCQQAPHLIARIQRLTWMGGSTGRGNQTPFAEFNAWADARAAAIVMASGIPVRMVDLEVCRQVQLFPDDLAPLKGCHSNQGRVLHDLLGGYLDIGLSRGRDSMSLYDPVAAAVVLAPEDFNLQATCIQVDTDDAEREGQTRLQNPTAHSYPHEIVTLRNPAGVKTRIMDALMFAATN